MQDLDHKSYADIPKWFKLFKCSRGDHPDNATNMVTNDGARIS